MTLFELLYTMERVFIFSKKKLKIRSNKYYLDEVPYYLLKKEVINFTICDDVIEIFLKIV